VASERHLQAIKDIPAQSPAGTDCETGSNMAEQAMHRGADFSGALLAWKRRGSQSGVVMTLQIVENADQDNRCHRVKLQLNDRQLRSIARDLVQIAHERGIEVRTRRSLRERIRRLLKAVVN
jgi:hypothetical protein